MVRRRARAIKGVARRHGDADARKLRRDADERAHEGATAANANAVGLGGVDHGDAVGRARPTVSVPAGMRRGLRGALALVV